MRLFLILFCSLIALSGTITAQDVFYPDSVTLITELEEAGELRILNGEPFTGEAFFLQNEGLDPMVMRSYVNGKQEGTWRAWHSNGHLYKEGQVKDGQEQGRYLEYHQNGILCYEYFYDMGKKTGRWRSWYEDGSVYTERNFENDKLHGRLVHYDESGEALVTEEYKQGRVVATTRNKKPRVPQHGGH